MRLSSLLTLLTLILPSVATAQVVPDTTVGTQLIQNFNINNTNSQRIDGGMISGSNLFHSFREFNIEAGRGVYFTNPTNITTIFTRVTGSNPSNINGTLGILGDANLFLMNPNGVVFGSSASLDIKGSFIGTTASSINFSDGNVFSAVNPQPTSILSVSVPVGLGFGTQPKAIVNQSQQGLQLQPGKTLALIGGDIFIEGGNIIVPRGNIELGSVGSNNLVNIIPTDTGWAFKYNGVQSFQDIKLTASALVDASGTGAGNIQVQARNLLVENRSNIKSDTIGSEAGGTINIRASESVIINDVSSIYGNVTAEATGKGVSINISTPRLSVLGISDIGVYSSGIGDAGNLNIEAADIEVAGYDTESEYWSSLYNTAWEAEGNGGNLNIEAQRIRLYNGGVIGASTWSKGNAGNISITASEYIKVIGSDNSDYPTAIRAEARPESTGNGGNVLIKTPLLRLENQGKVSVSNLGTGNAGDLKINVNNLELDTAGVINATVNNGNQGNITIDTDIISMRQGSNISTNAGTNADGGNILINANAIVQLENSDITANAIQGKGGNIKINTQAIFASSDSNITAASERGISGAVNITTPDVKQESSLKRQANNFINTDNVIANSCIAYKNSNQGSFVVTGNGGLSESPNQSQDLNYSIAPILSVDNSRLTSSQINQNQTTWKLGDKIEEASQLFASNGKILLVSNSDRDFDAVTNLICKN
jgi:filamentous hemagglutinin family protein